MGLKHAALFVAILAGAGPATAQLAPPLPKLQDIRATLQTDRSQYTTEYGFARAWQQAARTVFPRPDQPAIGPIDPFSGADAAAVTAALDRLLADPGATLRWTGSATASDFEKVYAEFLTLNSPFAVQSRDNIMGLWLLSKTLGNRDANRFPITCNLMFIWCAAP